MIRVFLADDHPCYRSGVKNALSDKYGIELVGECDHTDHLLKMIVQSRADILFLDVSMPSQGGIRMLAQLRSALPKLKVIVLTMHEDASILRAALALGVYGYVLKTAGSEELCAAIRAVHSGRLYLDVIFKEEWFSKPLIEQPIELKRDPIHMLSQRELEVLKLLAYGYTNSQIAAKLTVSVKSVDSYRERIYVKLNISNRVDLVRFALEAGMLTPGVSANEVVEVV